MQYRYLDFGEKPLKYIWCNTVFWSWIWCYTTAIYLVQYHYNNLVQYRCNRFSAIPFSWIWCDGEELRPSCLNPIPQSAKASFSSGTRWSWLISITMYITMCFYVGSYPTFPNSHTDFSFKLFNALGEGLVCLLLQLSVNLKILKIWSTTSEFPVLTIW